MRISSIIFIAVLLSCLHQDISAQESDEGIKVFLHPKKFYKKFFPHLKVKKPDLDTNYIKTYPNFLTVGAHLILPDIYIDLLSKGSSPGAAGAVSNWRTNIGNIMAFTASYRFVTAGFAVVLSSNRKDKDTYASSSYRTATIKYNGEAASFQFKYIRTKGFTDVNEANSDSLKKYTKRDDLLVKEFQFEALYNFSWKKYCYAAPIDYTHRQLKTRIGFMIKAGAYYNSLSADSNLLTVKQRAFFEDFNDIRIIRTTSFKLAPGIGTNLVFLKRFYASFAVFTPYNLYVYNYFTKDGNLVHKGVSLAFVLDANVCVGYQSERLYVGFRYQLDSKSVSFNQVGMNSRYSYFGFDIGYRFKAPKPVKKVYKATMPPGM
jgi:hypothetical protein